MESLAVKFGILAGLFGVIGLIGLAALLGSVIWLVIRVANFDSVLPALLCIVISIALTAGGLVWSPAPEIVRMEPLKAPWEAPLEALKDQAGKLKDQVVKLKDNGPWARFFKDEDPADEGPAGDAPETGGPADDEGGNAPPEMELVEAVRTSAPGQEDGDQETVPAQGTRSPAGRNQSGEERTEGEPSEFERA